MDNNKVKLQIWDTAGQERFKTITNSFYRGAHSVIIVFDNNNKNSFQNAKDNWFKEINEYCGNEIVKVLVANKSDLDTDINREEITEFCKKNELLFFEASAKTGKNVDKLFFDISRKLINLGIGGNRYDNMKINTKKVEKEDDICNC